VKERLTGAIVLVVLIVLLVPELLSGPKGSSAPVSAGSAPTSSEEPPLRSYTINLGDDSHSRAESAGSSGPAMPQPSGPEQPALQPGAPAPDTSKAQSEPSPATSSPTTSAKASGASQASGAPEATGSPTASSPKPESQASVASQVSGGSQAARPGEAAVPGQRAAKSTTSAQKPTSPASAAAPRSEPSKPARAAATVEKPAKTHPSAAAATSESGWGVQLGVFASRENAERLALDVRVKGFKASVSPVTSGSRKLYKVRVGPTPDRAAAQELQGRLKAAGRPGGTVVPYS
jgi:cell division septation protein DedD